MLTQSITLRKGGATDLPAINQLIDAAIMTWGLPERVKRLSLPSYHYKEHDLQHIELTVAEDEKHVVIGVTAWEQADSKDTPEEYSALLLHGIYIDPQYQHQGIGKQLLQTAERAAVNQNFDGLLVKAQADAAGFFQKQGMQQLEITDARRDYAYRYWKLLTTKELKKAKHE